jgi:hypothetical protein
VLGHVGSVCYGAARGWLGSLTSALPPELMQTILERVCSVAQGEKIRVDRGVNTETPRDEPVSPRGGQKLNSRSDCLSNNAQ